jgi:hypothetical protein
VNAQGPTILLLTFARQGEEGAIRGALAWLSQQAPGAEFVAVGTPVSAPVLNRLGLTDVIIFGDGASTRQVVGEARARRPKITAIVYGGPGSSAHLKLELVALGAAAPVTYRFVPDTPPRPIGRWALLASVATKALSAAGRLVAGCVVCGIAFCWLRLAQLLTGGQHARG